MDVVVELPELAAAASFVSETMGGGVRVGRMILAGVPTAVAPSGTGFKTIDPAPILTLLPIRILPKIDAPLPTITLWPSFG